MDDLNGSGHIWVHKELVAITLLTPSCGKVRPSAALLNHLQSNYQNIMVQPLGVLNYSQFQPALQGDPMEQLHVGDQIRTSKIIIFSNGNWMVSQCKFIDSLKAQTMEGFGVVILSHPSSLSSAEVETEPVAWTSAMVTSFAFDGKKDLRLALPNSMTDGRESLKTGDLVWFTASKGQPDCLDSERRLVTSKCQYMIMNMKTVPFEAREGDPQLPGYPVTCLKELYNPPSTLTPKEALCCVNLFWRTLITFETEIQSHLQEEKVLFPAELEYTQWRCPIKGCFSYPAFQSKLNPRKGDTLSFAAYKKHGDKILSFSCCYGTAVVTDCHPNGQELLVCVEFSKNTSFDLMFHKANDQQTIFRIMPVYHDLSLANFKRLRTRMDLIFKQARPLQQIFEMLIGRVSSDQAESSTFTPWRYGKDEIPGIGSFEPDPAQETIFNVIHEKRPLVVVPGPAGCGKTRTLVCAVFHELDTQITFQW